MGTIRKYHNHKLQKNQWYREEEPHNNHETPGRQTTQSNQLSLPHRADCKARMGAQRNAHRNIEKLQNPTPICSRRNSIQIFINNGDLCVQMGKSGTLFVYWTSQSKQVISNTVSKDKKKSSRADELNHNIETISCGPLILDSLNKIRRKNS